MSANNIKGIEIISQAGQLPKVEPIEFVVPNGVYEKIEENLDFANKLIVDESSLSYAKDNRLEISKIRKEIDSRYKQYIKDLTDNAKEVKNELIKSLENVEGVYKAKEDVINDKLKSIRVKMSQINLEGLINESGLPEGFIEVKDLWTDQLANKGSFKPSTIDYDIIDKMDGVVSEFYDIFFVFKDSIKESLEEKIEDAKLTLSETNKIEDNELKDAILLHIEKTKDFNFLKVKNLIEEKLESERLAKIEEERRIEELRIKAEKSTEVKDESPVIKSSFGSVGTTKVSEEPKTDAKKLMNELKNDKDFARDLEEFVLRWVEGVYKYCDCEDKEVRKFTNELLK